jgi:hypothetical protein
MSDEQQVTQQLRMLRGIGFVEFIGQGLIKEVQPPDSPEVSPETDPLPTGGHVGERRLPWDAASATMARRALFLRAYACTN